jgi:tetratricopeptide (TPR) repeat protein
MPDIAASSLPQPSPEQRRIAAGQFDRANQVIATGNYDYGIRLLLSCCKLDPANLNYRLTLRRTEKTKYRNNLRGHWLAWLTTWPIKARIKAALRGRDYLKVLEHGEQVLTRNPWDTGAQMDMAHAADALGLLDLAIWTLEQARQKNAKDVTVNRTLARYYEKRGKFTQAIALWEQVRKAIPSDVEAQSKAKDLAASETIARGGYEASIEGQHQARGAAMAEAAADPPPAPAPGPAAAAPAPPAPAARGPSGVRPGSREIALPGADRQSGEIAKLRARIEADPTVANAHMQLALFYRRAGQIDQARQTLQAGLDATGNSFELGLELADLEIEPFRRNLAAVEERVRGHPADEEARKVRLRLLREINSREMELFRQKADRFPTELVHRFELGVRLLRAGQVDEAIRELQASRSDPRHQWRSLLYLGHCFRSRHNWRLAKRNFEEALRQLPAGEDEVRKEILFHLAQGSAEEGELAEAIDLGTELANLDFAYRDIGQLLDEWQTRLQQKPAPVTAKPGDPPASRGAPPR